MLLRCLPLLLATSAWATTIDIGAAFKEMSLTVGPYVRNDFPIYPPLGNGSIETRLFTWPRNGAVVYLVLDAGGQIVPVSTELDALYVAGIFQGAAWLFPNSSYTIFLYAVPNAYFPSTVPVTLNDDPLTDYTFGPAHSVGNPEPRNWWLMVTGLSLLTLARLRRFRKTDF